MILNPQAIQRVRAGTWGRAYFGGGSKSNTSNTSQQTYNDQRQAVQDGIALGQGAKADWNSVSTDSHAVSNSGNTSTTTNANWWNTSSDSHAVSNSGNTSDSGNTYNIGTDPGVAHIAELSSQLMQAQSEDQLRAVMGITKLGASVGQSAADLAAMGQQNSLTLSQHMLDLTAEAMDKITTGTGSAVAMQSAAAQAETASAQAMSGQVKIMLYAVGALAIVAVLMRK